MGGVEVVKCENQVLTKMKEQVDCMLSPLYQDSLNMITSVKVGRS